MAFAMEILILLLLLLYVSLVTSHGCLEEETETILGSTWQLGPTTTAINKLSIVSMPVLQSRNGFFSLVIYTSPSRGGCKASVVNRSSGLELWSSQGFFHSSCSTDLPCELQLDGSGNLLLRYGDFVLWESHTAGFGVEKLKLLDNGNLVMLNQRNHVIWQSFNCSKAEGEHYLQEEETDQSSHFSSSSSSSTRRDLREDEGSSAALTMEIVLPVVCLLLFLSILYLTWRWLWKTKKQRQISVKKLNPTDEAMLESLASGLPPRFTYEEMQKATNGFQKKLGEGGFGVVYEGTLTCGTRIAVKVFNISNTSSCRKGFYSEVMSIGEKQHHNLVKLCGFCAEDNHRMLVYELMENGSLRKALFTVKADGNEEKQHLLLSWEKRRSIAIDTAKALAFLHEGDEDSRIVHCDVKPDNILLNQNWEAKVSDFGLAKMLWHHHQYHPIGDDDAIVLSESLPSSSQSRFTFLSGIISSKGIRGTFGYLAPEWTRLDADPDHITPASDVYSYGVVLLELIAGRRCMVPGLPFLPGLAFDLLANNEDLNQLLDSRLLETDIDPAEVTRFANIALWCLQEDLVIRPSMADVIEMLTGQMSVKAPPVCDYFAGSSQFFNESNLNKISPISFIPSTPTISGTSESFSILSGR